MTNRNPRKQVTYSVQQLQRLLSNTHDGAVDACIELVDEAVAAGTPAADIPSYVGTNRPKFSAGGGGGGVPLP